MEIRKLLNPALETKCDEMNPFLANHEFNLGTTHCTLVLFASWLQSGSLK